MGTKNIKHGLTELNVYEEKNSLTLIEIFKSRGLDVKKDNICLQIELSREEVKELINFLSSKMDPASLSLEEIKNSIFQFKKEKLPDAESPFHYEAEIWSGMKHFMIWLESKNS